MDAAMTVLLYGPAAMLAGWWIFLVATWLAAPYVIPSSNGAFTNGLRVVIPPYYRALMPQAELAAIIAHEFGHVALWHPQKALIRAALLWPLSAAERHRHEVEADEWATGPGRVHPAALAAGLRRVAGNSRHPSTDERLVRLEIDIWLRSI